MPQKMEVKMKKEKENEVEQKKDLNCITKEDIMLCSKQFMKPYENLIYKDIKIIIDMENLLEYEKSKMRNIIKLIQRADRNESSFLLKVYSTTKKSLSLMKDKNEDYKNKLAEELLCYVKMIEKNNLSIKELPALDTFAYFSEEDEWIETFIKKVADTRLKIMSMDEYLGLLNDCIVEEYSPLYDEL